MNLRATPSALGERQMFPMHMNKMLILPLFAINTGGGFTSFFVRR
jgi:hypothetical protein